MANQSNWYFWTYKLLNDAPGTPPAKRCVECKVAASAFFGVLGPISAYKVYKHRTSEVKSLIYLGVAIGSILGCALSAKMAIENQSHNKKLTAEYLEEIKQKRSEFRQTLQNKI